MADPLIETDRLLLRRWRQEDVEPFAAICADPAVMRYIGSGAVRTLDQTRASIDAFERNWNEKGYGLFAVERRDDGEFIGFTGLSAPLFLPEILPAVEIGWRLSRQSWGHGYATEAARAALHFGLHDLRLPDVVSICQAENQASVRIMQKLGMVFDRETIAPAEGRIVHVYRIMAADGLQPEPFLAIRPQPCCRSAVATP